MKKIKNILIISLLSLLGTGCSDFLEVTSKQELTYETFYKTAGDCRSATAVLYNAVWFDFNSKFLWEIGDSRANNMYVDLATYASAIFNRFMETSNTDDLENGWDAFYSVIGQSDHILNNLYRALDNGVDPTVVNACKGEARFMRGLAYWYLACVWGNVPIVEDPVQLSTNFVVRSNHREDVLQYAIKDMEFAATYLPESDEPGRLTRYSALGMLSRLYITAACYARGGNFTPERYETAPDYYYRKAAEAALTVCEEGIQYSLLNDYEQLFRVQNNNSSESLFALQWVPGSTVYGVGNRMQINLCYSTEMLGGLKAYGGSGYLSAEFVELMHKRGELSRKRATFFYNGAAYDYIGTATDAGKWVVTGRSMCNVKKHIVGGTKDTDGGAVAENSGFATPMLRLAEVYLLYAEAVLGTKSEIDGTTVEGRKALLYFNKVRERARDKNAEEPNGNLADLDKLTLDDIWTERRCELAMEGQFWYDIVRRAFWNKEWVLNFLNNQKRGYKYSYDGTTFKWGNSDGRDAKPATEDKLLLPYPLNEVTMNPLLREEPVHFDIAEE